MKRLLGLLTTLACVMVFAICSLAGEWKSDAKGWWYVNDNGTYPTSTWQTIGTSDYYFGADGYLLVNTTTPDGFKVNADGAKLSDALTHQPLCDQPQHLHLPGGK